MKNSIHAGNYLLQLYYETDYRFDRRKVIALLFFSNLALLIDDNPGIIIDEPIIFQPWGISIESISEHFNFLSFGFKHDERIKIDYNKPQPTNNNFRKDYRYDPNFLTELQKKVIFKLFIEFGSYNSVVLMNVINNLHICYPKTQKKDITLYYTNKIFDSYLYHLKNQKLTHLKENTDSIKGTELVIHLIYNVIKKYKL